MTVLVEAAARRPAPVARCWADATHRLVAACLLVLLAPALLGLLVLVRVTTPGPALFRQVRVGRQGRLFVMYKLRTMTDGAERLRDGLLGLNEHADGPLFKLRHDPRITIVGRWLRRFSLDELPQLWNVVRGDMALVGPRPPLPEEVARYTDAERRRLDVKPGLTGLWQVSGRSSLSWADSVRLDLHYVENWHPAMDVAILARTLVAVIGGRGAY